MLDLLLLPSSCPLGLLLIANEAPSMAVVMSWVDYGTMGLLFGMMLIVGQVGGWMGTEAISLIAVAGQWSPSLLGQDWKTLNPHRKHITDSMS
jgi:hypothetical protein